MQEDKHNGKQNGFEKMVNYIGKWELRLSTEKNSAIDCWNALKDKLSFLDRLQ